MESRYHTQMKTEKHWPRLRMLWSERNRRLVPFFVIGFLAILFLLVIQPLKRAIRFEELEHQDFSFLFAQRNWVSADEAYDNRLGVGIMLAAAMPAVSSDQKLLSVSLLANGSAYDPAFAFMLAAGSFQSERGFLPRSEVELMDFLLDGAPVNQLKLEPRDVLLNRIGGAIDPHSGRVYGSFRKQDWQAGGMYLQPLQPVKATLSNRVLSFLGLRRAAIISHDAQGKGYELRGNSTTFEKVESDGSSNGARMAESFVYGMHSSKPGEILFEDACIP